MSDISDMDKFLQKPIEDDGTLVIVEGMSYLVHDVVGVFEKT